MRITITCPSCRKKSQIDDTLKGKRLRCPYQDCRQPFRLSEAGEAVLIDQPVVEQPKVVDWQATQGTSPSRARDMPAVADWQAAPPPARGEEPFSAAEPAWQGGGGWQGQPAQPASYSYEGSGEVSYEATSESGYHAPVKKKRAGLFMLVFLAVGIVALAAGGLVYVKMKGQAEDRARNDAKKEFDAGHFGAAEKKFSQLAEKFPDSKEIGLYRFMSSLAGLRATALESDPDLAKGNETLKKFYNDYRGKPHYKDHLNSVWQMTVDFTNTGLNMAEKTSKRDALEKAQAFFVLAKDIGLGLTDPKVAEQKNAEIEEKQRNASFSVYQAEARKTFLTDLVEIITQGKPSGVEKAQADFVELIRRYPKLEKDTEIKGKLTGLEQSEPSLIKYTLLDQKLDKPKAGPGDGSSLLIVPLVAGRGTPATSDAPDPIVFSLARGILYAHSSSTGDVRWAMRVGIDTHTLPVRMPARPPQPEIALVLSTDTTANTSTVIAIDTRTGEARWAYSLGSMCPAGPIIAGIVAYFPTTDGRVHEVEAIEGKLRGIFDVGQPLTVPGSYDPTARRLFVPADRKRIYVLDVGEKKQCAGVYYTNHTVGGLRGAPIVTPSLLVIAEGNSLGSMQIKSFSISDTGDKATEAPEKFKVRGWSWYQPYYDGDTLGYLTDRGALALFGVKRNTPDKNIFMLGTPPGEGRSGGDTYGMPVGEQGGLEAVNQPPIGPAQVAHVDLNEWWLLVAGKLYRYRFDLYRQQLVRAPTPPLAVGMPLQPSQARGQNLILGTQALDRCLLTAVDRNSGGIAWQRQLGLMTGQDPIVLGTDLIAIDKAGGLFHLEAAKVTGQAAAPSDRIQGPSAGAWLANGISGMDPASPPRIVASADGTFAVAVLHDASTDKVILRRYEPGKGITAERTYRFESAPLIGGTAALNGQSLVIPCRDGNLRELPLEGLNALPVALAWRNREVGAGAIGHAAFLSDSQLVATDGFRKLLRWERDPAAGNRWRRITNADLEFTGRIVTPVVLVDGAQGEKLVCLGDDTGGLYLVSTARNEYVRTWRFPAPGRITKGPFVRGKHIGVVLDGSTLVWLDPQKDALLWERPFDKLGIAGEPQKVGNLILVAENTGRYYWLDEAGADKGSFEPRASVVPATAAVPIGPNHAFAPLSDGTAFLLAAPTGAAPPKAE